MFRTLMTFLLTMCFLPAQERCPDHVITKVDMSFTMHGRIQCGSGVTYTPESGVTVTVNSTECPLLAIYRPEHDTWQSAPGSGFFTKVAEQKEVWHFTYGCASRWLLGFIPIEVASNCVEVSRSVMQTVDHHKQYQCEDLQQ